MTTLPNERHARIIALVEAMNGTPSEITTVKRGGGYWYAKCGRFETPKGNQGADGAEWAITDLLRLVETHAASLVSTLRFRRSLVDRTKQAEAAAIEHLDSLRRDIIKKEEAVAAARVRADDSLKNLNDVLRESTDCQRAVCAVMFPAPTKSDV